MMMKAALKLVTFAFAATSSAHSYEIRGSAVQTEDGIHAKVFDGLLLQAEKKPAIATQEEENGLLRGVPPLKSEEEENDLVICGAFSRSVYNRVCSGGCGGQFCPSPNSNIQCAGTCGDHVWGGSWRTEAQCSSWCEEQGDGCCEYRTNGACSYKSAWQISSSDSHDDSRAVLCLVAPAVNAGHYDAFDWWELPTYAKYAARRLGYDAPLWDANGLSSTSSLEWSQLSAAQKQAAAVMGYNEASWNADQGRGERSGVDQ